MLVSYSAARQPRQTTRGRLYLFVISSLVLNGKVLEDFLAFSPWNFADSKSISQLKFFLSTVLYISEDFEQIIHTGHRELWTFCTCGTRVISTI